MNQTPPPRLPIDVRPVSGETLDSYVRSLARANHLHPAELRAHLARAGSAGPVQLDRLAAVTGRTASDLRQALTDTRCHVCHQPLPPRAAQGPARRYCSRRCRILASNDRIPHSRHDAQQRVRHAAPCIWCGTVVERNRPFRWCSEPCRQATYEDRQRLGQCGHCSRHLLPDTRASQGEGPPLWCSTACRTAAERTRLRPRQEPNDPPKRDT